MSKTSYNIQLKGYGGGYDFDRATVDKELAKNEGKQVNFLIDSLGGSLATGLSISAAFKNHGEVSDHFVGMNASAATIASLGAAHISFDKNAMYLVHKCSTALHNQGGGSAMPVQAQHCAQLALDFIDWGCEELEHFEDCYVGEYDSEEDFAREIVNDCYDLEKQMGHLANYFDYDAYARDLFMWDYYYDKGYVFRHY